MKVVGTTGRTASYGGREACSKGNGSGLRPIVSFISLGRGLQGDIAFPGIVKIWFTSLIKIRSFLVIPYYV